MGDRRELGDRVLGLGDRELVWGDKELGGMVQVWGDKELVWEHILGLGDMGLELA